MTTVSTRSQIYDLLTGDSTLMSMVSGGIVDERELKQSTNVPCLVLVYVGHHPHQSIPELDEEAWEIQCFDRGNLYYNIERILERVRYVLHRKSLAANTSGLSAPGEIMYGFRSKSKFDPVFRFESQGEVFFVPIFYSS